MTSKNCISGYVIASVNAFVSSYKHIHDLEQFTVVLDFNNDNLSAGVPG